MLSLNVFLECANIEWIVLNNEYCENELFLRQATDFSVPTNSWWCYKNTQKYQILSQCVYLLLPKRKCVQPNLVKTKRTRENSKTKQHQCKLDRSYQHIWYIVNKAFSVGYFPLAYICIDCLVWSSSGLVLVNFVCFLKMHADLIEKLSSMPIKSAPNSLLAYPVVSHSLLIKHRFMTVIKNKTTMNSGEKTSSLQNITSLCWSFCTFILQCPF